MDNPKEEILLPPAYTLLEFGDGYLALTAGGIETKDSDGREIVEFMIEPTLALRKRYNISDDQLNNNRQMPYIVLKDDLIYLNIFDDANRKILYLKTFDRQESDVGKKTFELRKKLEEFEKRVWLLEGEIISLSEQLNIAKTNPAEFLAQSSEALKVVSESVLDILKARKGKEVEEND